MSAPPFLLTPIQMRRLSPHFPRSHGDAHSDRVQFVEQRFEDSDAQGPFDAIVGSSVLHHLELRPALERIFQLLRPGGWMSFAEPNMLNPQIVIQKNVDWIKRRAGDSHVPLASTR